MGRINAHGSCDAARSSDRPNDRLSTPEVYEHPESFCGQFYDASHILDWQRPRCFYHQSGAARLSEGFSADWKKQSRRGTLFELLLESVRRRSFLTCT